MYNWMIFILVVIQVTSVLFALSASFYLSKSDCPQWIGIVAVVTYFMLWLTIAGGYGYIMIQICKGNTDMNFEEVGLPVYRNILWVCYLLFTFAYPIMLIMVVIKD